MLTYISLDIYPVMIHKDHTVVLLLAFEGPSKLISIVSALFAFPPIV
jgi:hypothetical protein